MDLYKWTAEYIRFRDVMLRRIANIEEKHGEIKVTEKNKTIKTYIIREDLKEAIEEIHTNHKKEEHLYITCLNTKQNAETLIKEWKKILKFKDITIIFSHPGTNEKWLIHPQTHNKISEEKQLKESIMTLFDGITRV